MPEAAKLPARLPVNNNVPALVARYVKGNAIKYVLPTVCLIAERSVMLYAVGLACFLVRVPVDETVVAAVAILVVVVVAQTAVEPVKEHAVMVALVG